MPQDRVGVNCPAVFKPAQPQLLQGLRCQGTEFRPGPKVVEEAEEEEKEDEDEEEAKGEALAVGSAKLATIASNILKALLDTSVPL